MIDEAVLRTDITKAATGFGNKRYLDKPLETMKKKFARDGAKKQLEHHSTMADGTHVFHGIDHAGLHHYVTTNKQGNIDRVVATSKQGKAHKIETAVASGGAGVHKMYHHLITKHNHILTSDEQSHGGLSIWQKMRKMGGVNIHGFHKKTGRGEHIDIVRHPEESHVSNKDLETLRKAGGGTREQRKKEYAAAKKTQSMTLVAHKDRNIKKSRTVKESASATVLRVIRESIGE